MPKPIIQIFSIAALTLAVAGCGTNPKERALSGGAIGAGAGTLAGAVTGLSLFEGALIGAGAGALIGAVTNQNQINLGSLSSGGSHAAPQKAAAAQARPASAASPLVRDVQSSLAKAGYDPGPADGVSGPRTSKAIAEYQRDKGLAVDGQASVALRDHIRS